MNPIGTGGVGGAVPRRIFLSHTSDLGKPDEKGSFVAAAVAAVLRARHAVTDMSYFAAREVSPATLCMEMVARSDIYVGIIGMRYGSPVRDRPDISYTELEFETAGMHGEPRLIFLIREDSEHLVPADESSERRAWQDAFRARLLDAHLTVAEVRSPADLEVGLLHSLMELGSAQGAVSHDPMSRPWCLPLRRNAYFTGREAYLRRLHEALQTRRIPQAITGLAGVGKTQTALEYASRWRDAYSAVLWADATSQGSLTAAFTGFADALSLPVSPDDDPRLVVVAVMRWLERNPGWLLVLDNVDDLATAEAFLPAGQGSVVLTMQAQASGTVAEGIELEDMPADEAALFLLRRAKVVSPDGRDEEAPPEERDAAAEIVATLGGLSLALDQAGAYVEETGCGLAGYLARYHMQQGELLSRRGVQSLDHPASVVATFALTLRQVQRAADVLRLSAFLHPDGIPEELFDGGAVPACADQLAFDSALEVLRRYSLVRRDRAIRAVTVHRLVQEVVRGAMDPDERRLWAERAVHAVERVVPELQTATWRGVQRYAQQALKGAALIDEWEIESPEAARLLDQLGSYLGMLNQHDRADALLRRGLAMREAMFGPDDPQTATSVAHLARLATDEGHYDEAAELYRRALEARERAFGSDHAEVADSLTGLGAVYHEVGRDAEAERLYRRALEVQEATVGPDHPDTAFTLTLIGMLCRRHARWSEAEPLLLQALAIRERELGPEHPRVGMVLNNLAVVLADQGRYDEAVAYYRRTLALYEQVLGPDHASVAVTLHNLAGVHRDRGELQVAEDLYRRSLAIREGWLGPDHPTIAYHLSSLANVLQKQGLLDEAHSAATRALAIWQRTHGAGHVNVVRALTVLARVAADRGDLPQAVDMLGKALGIYRRMLGPLHHGTQDLEAEFAQLHGALQAML